MIYDLQKLMKLFISMVERSKKKKKTKTSLIQREV